MWRRIEVSRGGWGTKVSLGWGGRVPEQPSLRRWCLKRVLFKARIFFLLSWRDLDYLPMNHPLTERQTFSHEPFYFLSNSRPRLGCRLACAPRIPVPSNGLTFKCFVNFNKARISPQSELVSLLFPLSPPPQLYNTNWCHPDVCCPGWEGQAHAHVTSGVRAYGKMTKGIKENRTCVTASPQGRARASKRSLAEAVVALGPVPSEAGILLALACTLTL